MRFCFSDTIWAATRALSMGQSRDTRLPTVKAGDCAMAGGAGGGTRARERLYVHVELTPTAAVCARQAAYQLINPDGTQVEVLPFVLWSSTWHALRGARGGGGGGR